MKRFKGISCFLSFHRLNSLIFFSTLHCSLFSSFGVIVGSLGTVKSILFLEFPDFSVECFANFRSLILGNYPTMFPSFETFRINFRPNGKGACFSLTRQENVADFKILLRTSLIATNGKFPLFRSLILQNILNLPLKS